MPAKNKRDHNAFLERPTILQPADKVMPSNTKKPFGVAEADMLERIDKLFAYNIGHHICLPQIVVVGNQSSGKSSVLEGLTNLPFPKDSGLCTRFATQITFKRSKNTSISVSVLPAKDARPHHASKCRHWKFQKSLNELEPDEFTQIMTEVNEVMGISATSNPPKTFSNDMLAIEVSGPEEEHLSVVDVPGIFKKTTEGQTTKADMKMVDAMVETFVSNPRTIILAVVPANVDVATQEILDIANKHDPYGERTLGVLTKPDLVDKGAEQLVLDLLDNKSHRLKLGWCIVRNLGQRDTQRGRDRFEMEEKFFQDESPWSFIAKTKVGVEALRKRLSIVWRQLTRDEFPQVKLEVAKSLKSSREELEGLGPQRATAAEQTSYLISIASEFEKMTAKAIEGIYHADEHFDQNERLRLANNIANREETFAKMFNDFAHSYKFKQPGLIASFCDQPDRDNLGISNTTTRLIKEPVPSLEDILDKPMTLASPVESGVAIWLSELYGSNRGFEIGGFDPRLLAPAMKEQSTKWRGVCRGYVSDVVVLTHHYIMEVIRLICKNDTRTRQGLLDMMSERMKEGYSIALAHVDFLLASERSRPVTQNQSFTESQQKSREQRVASAVEQRMAQLCGTAGEAGHRIHSVQNLNCVSALVNEPLHPPLSNRDHVVQEMHDTLQAYYDVASKRMVDDVAQQAVRYLLLSGPNSPLKVLTPELISTLSEEQLQRIAGEDELTKSQRADLKKKVAELTIGQKILQSP